MRLRIAPEVLALFPAALVGVVRVHGCDNSGGTPTSAANTVNAASTASGAGASDTANAASTEIEALLRRAETAARTALGALAGGALAQEPRIACWREAYRQFGASPKKSPSSIESLLRRVASGEPLRSINPLVDLYNAVSLERLLPAGGEDLAQVRGDIVLCRAGEAEPPVRLLGDAEARPPHPGEIIYRDEVAAICRRWNWREADRTKLSETTRDAVLVLEALPPTRRADLEQALADLAARITRCCGGEAHAAVMGAAATELDLGEAGQDPP